MVASGEPRTRHREAGGATSATPSDGLRGAAFEYALDPMLVVDAGGRVVELNAAACRLLCRTPEQCIGTPLASVVPADAVVRSALERARAYGDAVEEIVVDAPDGPPQEMELRVRAGLPAGSLLCVLRDVTEARRGERNLDAARRQLAESERLAALGVLVSGVGHEIRTPLTFIANSLFLLQREIEAAVERGEAPETVLQGLRPTMRDALSGVERINHLVLELRRFAKRKTGTLVRTRLDPPVREAVALFLAAGRSRARIQARLAPTPEVLVDITQVQQVVLNLLDNAAEATGGSGRVEVETGRDENGYATLQVRDHGPGIPPEVQARIFEGFFTTKAEGTGLGLSIVRRLVEAHGGRIGFETAPGQGTTFTVRLPAATAPPRA